MKRVLILLLFVIGISSTGYAQFGVAVHQSNLPFIGFNYQVGERFIPEVRFNTDAFREDVPIEAALNFVIKKEADYQFYAGVGFKSTFGSDLIVPIGLNVYPFDNKNFGFHIEATGFFGDSEIIRGSWGIRYRFNKK